MFRAPPSWSRWSLGVLLVAGCGFPVREQADEAVCQMATRPVDSQAPIASPPEAKPAPAEPKAENQPAPIVPVLAQQPGAQRPRPQFSERLQIPPEIPGSNAPPIKLPPRTASPKEREAAVDRLYQPLPPVGALPEPAQGPDGHPLTLSDLQSLALTNNPTIRQAAFAVEGARGVALQAGLYPNPSAGYQADTVGTAGGAGYQGAFIEQLIKTGG